MLLTRSGGECGRQPGAWWRERRAEGSVGLLQGAGGKGVWRCSLRVLSVGVWEGEVGAALPDNPATQQALETEIARALQEDGALRQEIARLWGEAQDAGVTIIASGNRSVAIGGDVTGSTIITGDQNR